MPVMPGGNSTRRSNRFVEAFARGLSVIRAFGVDAPEMTLSRIVERTGLTRANVRRVLLTLVELGYVEQDGKIFRLRPRILDLGYAYLSSTSLARAAQPVMERVATRLQVPCNLTVLDGDDVIIIARIAVGNTAAGGLGLNIGGRFPAYVTPMGRLLLAGLPERELAAYFERANLKPVTARTTTEPARLRHLMQADLAKGWSLVDQEQGDTISSLAVPITDGKRQVAATLSLGWPSGEYTYADAEERLLPVLQEAASEVSKYTIMGSH